MKFSEWLNKNKNHLREYDAWEIARLGITCGFSMAEIGPSILDWVAFIQRRIRFWDSPLFDQWMCLMYYENGTDFEEEAHVTPNLWKQNRPCMTKSQLRGK